MMGTWNTGPFDNDQALDWLDELSESKDPLADIVRAVHGPCKDGFIDLDIADPAFASAAIIAGSLDEVYAATLPEEAQNIIDRCGTSLVRQSDEALKCLSRLLSDDSETWLEWKESDDGPQYFAAVKEVQEILS